MTDRPALTDTDFCADPAARVGSGQDQQNSTAVGVLRVHKFGGTSVDGAERLKALARIILQREDGAVVVVSAMAGVSNTLSALVVGAPDGPSAEEAPVGP